MSYINIPIVTDSDVLLQQALTNIATAIPGWVPREGNLEVLLLEEFANMVAEAANVASNVPDTIFQYFGSLVGVTQNEGVSATIQTTWTLTSAAPSGGYTIPAGTVAGFFFGGATYQFQTINDTTISSGLTTASITMQAIQPGSFYNIYNLTGVNPTTTYLQLLSQTSSIASILITATYANSPTTLLAGVDPESTTAYLNRLAAELQLLAPRPITPSDYALFSQNVTGVYRALAFDGFNPFTNRLGAADANFTTAANSASAPSGWGVFGNGTANVPTLSTPGTAGTNYLQITGAAASPVNAAAVQTATAVNATSLIVTTAGFSNSTISSVNPAFIAIYDSTNGNEIAMVTAATAASGGNQTLTIASPGLQYAHGTSATVTLLQGASMPAVTSLNANADWYQVASIIQSGTASNERAYVFAVATYIDGTTRVFSSLPQFDDSLYTYTTGPKTLVANVASTNANSPTSLAYDANVTAIYDTIKPYVSSIQAYIGIATTEVSKTNKVTYNSVNQVVLDIAGADSPYVTTSSYNFIPDATLSAYGLSNGSASSWTVPSGVNGLTNQGLQFVGTGSALGSALTATSQIFNLSHKESDNLSATARTYTITANINTTYATSTYADVSVKVVTVGASPTTLATLTASSASISTYVGTFSLSTPQDVQVQVVFGTGLNVPTGSSVIVSNIGLYSGTYTVQTLPEYEQNGYFWTTGGLYQPNTFNYARTVNVAPVDVNGMELSQTIMDTLHDYLLARREVNFVVNTMIPNYVPIDVQWSGYVQVGYTASSVQAAVNAAIRNFLSPASWAGGTNSPPYWDGSANVVRIMDIAGVIAGVSGVNSVSSVTTRLSYPLNGTYAATDITLPGVAPLPIANTITGTIYANALNAYSGLG